jgi:hypothetical protein
VPVAILVFLYALSVLGPDLSPARAATAAPDAVMSLSGTFTSGQAGTSAQEIHPERSPDHGDVSERPHDSERPHHAARLTPPGVSLPAAQAVPAARRADPVRSADNPPIALTGRIRPGEHPSGCRLALLQVFRC